MAVGSDPRVSGGAIVAAFAAGAASRGASVVDAGLSTTPAMFMSTILPDLKFDGAVMATASHLPYNRNGLKFFVAEGGLDKGDIKASDRHGGMHDAGPSGSPFVYVVAGTAHPSTIALPSTFTIAPNLPSLAGDPGRRRPRRRRVAAAARPERGPGPADGHADGRHADVECPGVQARGSRA